MSIAIMSAFGRTLERMTANGSTQTSKWMGRLKVKPGSRYAAEFRPPSH